MRRDGAPMRDPTEAATLLVETTCVRRPILLLALLLQCSSPTPEPPCTGTCSTDRGYDAKSYELIGRFDWARQRLVATEKVTLVTTTSSHIVELDGAVEVKSVRADGDQSPGAGRIDLSFVTGGNLLRIDLSPLHPEAGPVSFNIEYEASTSEALRASISRDDDPVTARVVYTDSEPFDGMFWLPANHRPADRAAFSVELTVAPNEDVIANGTRTKDEMRGGERVVRHEIREAIPTYTMAFAAGELEHATRATARVPLSVWYRRGLLFNPEEMLDFVAGAMSNFENLLGPYPWPGYAVVLLPEFSGGMENTTITFTNETSAQANLGMNLHAHELAHQWFGDWVTVATFDDVWIKEGLATLLAPEGYRSSRDGEGKGRLFGNYFAFNPADSIRDKSLVGIAKYTSGPYTRAAWLLTQIRAQVGEAAFWQSLRLVLAQYALGSISSEAFVRSFSLDEATLAKILRSLDEKRVPSVSITTEPGPGTRVTLAVADEGETMISPITLTVVDNQEQATSHRLDPGGKVTLEVPPGGYLAPDEQDVHPAWWASFAVRPGYVALLPLVLPSRAESFATRSAAHQERAFEALLRFQAELDIAPDSYAALYTNLDSSLARRSAELAGCVALKSHTNEAWASTLFTILGTPSLTSWSTAYANCETDLPTRLFGAELARLSNIVDAAAASRFVYLSGFDYGAAATLAALSQVATQASSLQLREHALTRLSYQAATGFGYTAVSGDELPVWKDFFRARLADAKSGFRFQMVWRGVVGLADDRALSLAGQKLRTIPLSDDAQRQVICDAYAMAHNTRAEAWTEFQQAAQPWDALGSTAKAVLMSGGASCNP